MRKREKFQSIDSKNIYIYYSAIKKKEIGSFVELWMDLECIIQSKVSQKSHNHILMHICEI